MGQIGLVWEGGAVGVGGMLFKSRERIFDLNACFSLRERGSGF